MVSLYIGGLLFAGALTLLPGRLMHNVMFAMQESVPDRLADLSKEKAPRNGA